MLKKIHDSVSKFYDKIPYLVNIIYDLLAIMVSFELGFYFKIAYGISIFIALEALHILKIPQNVFKNFNLAAVLLPALVLLFPFLNLLLIQEHYVSVIPLEAVKFLFAAHYIFSIWLTAGIFCAKYTKEGMIRAVKSLLSVGGLLFVFFIFLPTDSFIANANDFQLTYSMFIKEFLHAYSVYALPSVLILMCVHGAVFEYISDLLFGITLAVFVQYQFLNGHLALLGTSEADFLNNVPLIVINMLIWIVLISLPMALRQISKNKLSKIANVIGIFPIAFFLVSFTISLIAAPSYVFHITAEYYFDPSEQYSLSKDENVVVFILDAYDQDLLNKIIEEQPELLENYNDFTIYTDAVSVYDSTNTSLSQMFGGCQFDNTLTADEWLETGWNSDKTLSFYNNLHNNDYTVNFYNMIIPSLDCLEGKFDNLSKYDEPIELTPAVFDYYKFVKSMRALSLYRGLPYVFKQFIPIGDYEFTTFVLFDDYSTANYSNEDYEANLSLSIGNNSKTLSITHLKGTHLPYDAEVESVHLLQIMSEYLNQLKALGIYDNTSIIIMSDHGEHRETVACQPIFMVKRAGASSDTITFDASPIYYEDIMATLAELTNLCPIADPSNPYGTSIFSLNEDTIRTRVWYDRAQDTDYPTVFQIGRLAHAGIYNTYYKYEFTGTFNDLYQMTANGNITEIYPMNQYFG